MTRTKPAAAATQPETSNVDEYIKAVMDDSVWADSLWYRPRTLLTRAAFDIILTIVAEKLGDVPKEIVHSTADATLDYLKAEDLKDAEKKVYIDALLGRGASLRPEEFEELLFLGDNITDYRTDEEDEQR